MKSKVLLIALSLLAALSLTAADSPKPHIVMVVGDPEYESARTLPAFAGELEKNFGFKCTVLPRAADNKSIPGLEALETADLLLVYVRRVPLSDEQLSRVQKYLKSGKPVIGLRTASHAFQTWLKFDPEVLGGNYHGHYTKEDPATAHIEPKAAAHPILKNVPKEFPTGGTLYKTSPLATNTTVLLTGTIANQDPEPIAWTHDYNGARVFYTSLGHPQDFENPAFRQLLLNAVGWAVNLPPRQ